MVSTVSSAVSDPHSTDAERATAELTAGYPEAGRALIAAAIGAVAGLGDAERAHGLGTAGILAAMRMDAESVAAAILMGRAAERETLEKTFPPGVVALAAGAASMGGIEAASGGQDREGRAQVEAIRQMLLAMVEDIRVVIIKLAERTRTLRELRKADDSLRRPAAREVMDIYAPLANRLGVWQLKWELEDLSYRFLDAERYKGVAKLLEAKRHQREAYIAKVIALLTKELRTAGIEGEVSGRPKHIVSIINKMNRKQLSFEQIYDVRAVRILVPELKDCYSALGIVHHLWQPISGEFDDYISHPKPNGYSSLHSAVVGPDGLAVEVQIRTFDMHRDAELGVAAHWRYKEGGRDAGLQDKIAWLRQMLAWRDDMSDSAELAALFRNELFQDQVFALTPQGKVIILPKGATPIDFAYAVHTGLGNRCRGAKVDGRMVPLTHALKNGERVEIVAAKEGGPSRDWMNPTLGFARTSRARAKIRQWFNQQDHDLHIADGREILEREAKRMGVSEPSLDKLARHFEHSKDTEFLAALGRGDINNRQLAGALQEQAPKREAAAAPVARKAAAAGGSGILIEGVGNLKVTLARCCKPAPPDAIVAYATLARGVTVHRADCPSVTRVGPESRARILRADWGSVPPAGALFDIDLRIRAVDRQGLLRDVTDAISREHGDIVKTHTVSKGVYARMQFTVRIRDQVQTERILALVREVRGVIEADRRG